MKLKLGVSLALLLCVFSALLVGCKGGADAALVGSWKPTVPNMPAGAPALDPKMKQMMDSMTLELKGDGTFTQSSPAGALEGTWASADGKVTLTPTKMAGTAVEAGKAPTTELAVSADSKTLTMSAGGASLTYTKA